MSAGIGQKKGVSRMIRPMEAQAVPDAPLPAAIPAVEVRNLHFHYDTSDGQIHDISFAIQEGECIGIIGPNGAGKSTLLLHLNGVLPEAFSGAGTCEWSPCINTPRQKFLPVDVTSTQLTVYSIFSACRVRSRNSSMP